MEVMVKKYRQKYRKIRDEMDRWDKLQLRLLTQFRNASSIVERLPILQDPKNYGPLSCINGVREAILGKQMMSLEIILCSIKETMEVFCGIVATLEKNFLDGRQLLKGGPKPLNENQMQLRVGILPSIGYCVEGLRLLHEMHSSEYLFKSSIVSSLTLNKPPSATDLGALQQLLADQPNIPKEKVQLIFNTIFPEEIY